MGGFESVRRFRDDHSGQAILEVAIFAPFILLLLFIAVDFGRLSEFDTLVTSSSYAGAEYGAQSLTTANDSTGMTTAALADVPASSGIRVTNTSFYCTCADGSVASCSGTQCTSSHRLLFVKVTTSGKFTPFFSYFGVFGTTSHVHTTVMQVAV